MNASIIGAGIAGCATALFFKRANIAAELYEQRSAFDADEGLFLTLAPNGLRVLDELGIGAEVRREGVRTPGLVFVNGSGRLLGKVSLQDGERASFTIKRSALHRILQQELARQGVPIRYDTKLTGLEIRDAVHAHFNGNRTSTSEILVGCDGVHSRVRRTLFPGSPDPAATGLSSCGGFVENSSLAPTPEGMQMIYGENAFFGYIVSPSRDVYWFSTFESSALSDLTFDDILKDELLRLHANDGRNVRDIIAGTRRGIGVFAIHDILKFRTWTKGGAVLLGDAAHAASPHGGQGASMALEDAWCLTEVLRERNGGDSAARALRRFADQRRPRVERIVRWSRRRGSGKTSSSAAQRWLRDAIMPWALRVFAKPEKNAWVYQSPLGD